jgi:hypothetical protein
MKHSIKEANEEKSEKQRIILQQYLGQYYRAKMKKKQLETRLRDFRENMGSIKGMDYSPVPRSQTNKVGEGAASEVIRVIEIEERIEIQKKEMQETMLNVMKIMDFLPVDSTERIIMEYRHIDCIGWKQICREVNYSRSTCNDYYRAGIEKLLAFKKVQKIIADFSKSKEDE